jgi:uncharacterized membrane protein YdbT with pleckstrin-like domain
MQIFKPSLRYYALLLSLDILFIPVVVGILLIIYHFAIYNNSSLSLSIDGLTLKGGSLKPNSTEVLYKDISALSFHQSLLQKMLKTGTVKVKTEGIKGEVKFRNVENPEFVYETIAKLKETTIA